MGKLEPRGGYVPQDDNGIGDINGLDKLQNIIDETLKTGRVPTDDDMRVVGDIMDNLPPHMRKSLDNQSRILKNLTELLIAGDPKAFHEGIINFIGEEEPADVLSVIGSMVAAVVIVTGGKPVD